MKISLHDEAEAELNEAAEYYNIQRSGLGHEFLDAFYSSFETIRRYPENWPKTRGRFRRYLIGRFPFSIIYSIEPDTVFVIAIAHQSRHPAYWHARERH